MGIGKFSPVFKSFGCSGVIMQAKVLDETQGEVQMPIIRITLNTLPNEGYGGGIIARATGRRLVQECGAPLVGDHKVWIKSGRDIQQGRERSVLLRIAQMFSSEILHNAHPVDIGEQSRIAKTGAF